MENTLAKIPPAKYALNNVKHAIQIPNVQNAKSGTFCVIIYVSVLAKKDVTNAPFKILLYVNNVLPGTLYQLKWFAILI